MKQFSPKYRFLTYKDKNNCRVVIAISTYAGKEVRGTARCHPQEVYDEEFGKLLARARCDVKIAKKRVKRSQIQNKLAYEAAQKARQRCDAIDRYCYDAFNRYVDATDYLEELVNLKTD